jgi:hypothetical protein
MDIRRVLDALLAKTVTNGATPAEAVAAAEKAWALKAKYEAELKSAIAADAGGTPHTKKVLSRWRFLFARKVVSGIADFCEAAVAFAHIDSEDDVPPNAYVDFVGFRSDIDFAFDLLERLHIQMEASGISFFARTPSSDEDDVPFLVIWCHQRRSKLNDWERVFLDDMVERGDFSPKQAAKIRSIAQKVRRHKRDDEAAKDFIAGWSKQVAQRLSEAARERGRHMDVQQAEAAARKRAAVSARFKELYPQLVEMAASRQVENSVMFDAGVEEGRKAGFGKPTGRSAAMRLLGPSPPTR